MSLEFSEMKDRRLFERFSARFPAKQKDSREDFGTKYNLRDASALGARIVSGEKLLINDKIDLEVALPDGMDPFNLKGMVVWTRNIGNRAWEAGIKLEKIRLLHTSRLYKFVAPIYA